ncbi:MAG: hypothetical protein EB165_04050 [Euryarchaeota archaeon]|nr:hypothetical protein [Euryarchaeota archaeon]
MEQKELAQKIVERHKKMVASRSNWDSLWEEIATYVIPARQGFISKKTPGTYRGEKVFDSTAMHANSMLASHMHSSLTSPAAPWFTMKYDDGDLNRDDGAMEWLEDCAGRMGSAFSDSNFSTQVSEMYQDLCAFGTGAMFVEAATQTDNFKLQFHALHLGSICISENADGIVDTVLHKRTMSARQAMQRWPDVQKLDKISHALENNPDKEFAFLHCVMPNEDYQPDNPLPEPKYRKFISHWIAIEDCEIVDTSGYFEMPYLVPRWGKVTGDLFGFGPGVLARADIRTINTAKRLELAAWEKSIDPPIMASATGIIGDLHLEPAGLTFVRDMQSLAPLTQATQWQAVQIKSEELHQNIKSIYLIDQLNLGPQKHNTTATEIEIRYSLMNRVLGPTMGRLQQEFLNPLIERVFGVMLRNGEFAPQPDVLSDQKIDIEYQGPLARNQRMEDAQAIERLFGLAAQWAQLDPSALDIIDINGAMRILAERYGAPAKALKGEGEVQSLQEERAMKQAEQEQMMMEQSMAQTRATQAGGLKDAAMAAETRMGAM